MTTYDAAIGRAGIILARAHQRIQEGTPREAAERAYTPSGPSIDELETRIIRYRNSLTERNAA